MSEKLTFKNGMFYIMPAKLLRKTPNVTFNNVPIVEHLDAIDFVKHEANAISPAIEGRSNETFWYMHTHQADNLLVITGTRLVELYTKENNRVEYFEVTKDYVKHLNEDKILFEGMSIFGWPKYVFHRVNSAADGSNSINFASYDEEGCDIKTNFNIYSLNTETGEYKIEREGFRDQPAAK
jgi:hypothetical protein